MSGLCKVLLLVGLVVASAVVGLRALRTALIRSGIEACASLRAGLSALCGLRHIFGSGMPCSLELGVVLVD